MRRIAQPGPVPAARAVVVSAMLHDVAFAVPAGVLLLEGIRAGLAEAGFASAALTISGGGFGPFGYVIPAVSPDATRAAWYSDTRRPAGVSALEEGAVTFGTRDGAPFFHCHALWREADGQRRAGHVLPEETVVARPVAVRGVALSGAAFLVSDDAETGFRLFAPVMAPPVRDGGRPGLALRLRPNQDITLALEALAGGPGAALHGGVGSIIGARYAGAPPVEAPFTEMFLCAGSTASALRIAMVDVGEGLSEGALLRGENPVLMTLEAVLEGG